MPTDDPVIARPTHRRTANLRAVAGPAIALPATSKATDLGFLDAHHPSGLCVAGSVVNAAENQMIYGESDQVEIFFKVVSGVVRTCKFLGNGRRQINAFHIPGDLFGFETGLEHSLTAEAVCATVLIAYRCRSVEALAASNAQLAQQLLYFAIRNLVQAQEHAALLARKSAIERVATFLIDWTRCFPEHKTVSLPMTRRDIADYLGLTIETVSRSMSRFERRGLIALPSLRQIDLLDITRLRDLCI
jgi:CRP/FNR family nitrogen fixation transcriptional regulator